MSEGRRIKDITKAKEFLIAGKAIFTVVSTKTEKRYTFKVTQLTDRNKKKSEQDPNAPFFVSYLNGSDNGSSYAFLGSIFQKQTYRYSKKSKAGFESVVNKTFNWLFNTLITENTENFKMIEFWHEGKCGACGRRLTDPISIETGMGPICGKPKEEVVKRRNRNKLLADILND